MRSPTMPTGSEILRCVAVAPDSLAIRIEKSLTEGGYAPVMKIVRSGGDLARTLRESQTSIVFASSIRVGRAVPELLAAVREYDRALPVVMIAEPGEEEAAVEAMRTGARDYVITDHMHRLPAVV